MRVVFLFQPSRPRAVEKLTQYTCSFLRIFYLANKPFSTALVDQYKSRKISWLKLISVRLEDCRNKLRFKTVNRSLNCLCPPPSACLKALYRLKLCTSMAKRCTISLQETECSLSTGWDLLAVSFNLRICLHSNGTKTLYRNAGKSLTPVKNRKRKVCSKISVFKRVIQVKWEIK